jgi:hypothetical protein
MDAINLKQSEYRVLHATSLGHVRRTATDVDCIDRRRETPSGAELGFQSGRGPRVRMTELAAQDLAVLLPNKDWQITPAGRAVLTPWLLDQAAKATRPELAVVTVRRAG